MKGLEDIENVANKNLLFTIEGVRNPPSTAPITGFAFRTIYNEGGQILDQTTK